MNPPPPTPVLNSWGLLRLLECHGKNPGETAQATRCAIPPRQWTSPSQCFLCNLRGLDPSGKSFQLWNCWHHKPYPKDYHQRGNIKDQMLLALSSNCDTGECHWCQGKKLFIKSTLQKCSPTGLSHSENRKPTPISSEDHPMCPPPSTSCENAFMKFPQSQGQRAAPCRWGGMLGQEAHRLLTRRKINSGAGRVWIRNHWRNLPWEKALPK